MKTIRFSTLFLFLIFIVSCSEDNETMASIETSNLEGTWNLEDYYYTGNSKIDYPGEPMDMDYSVETSEVNATVEFTSDKKFISQGSISYLMTYDFMGEQMHMNIDNVDFNGTGEWTISGNKITISNQIGEINTQSVEQPQVLTYIVEELTATRMVLAFEISQEGSEEGIEYEMTITGKQVYSK